jgi:hypothetical protein
MAGYQSLPDALENGLFQHLGPDASGTQTASSTALDVAVFGVSDRTWVEAAEEWWRPGAGPAWPNWTRAAESA